MTVVFNATGVKPTDLIEVHALNLANKLVNEPVKGEKDATTTQLRRFYQEFLQLRQKVKNNPETFEQSRIPLKMLIAKSEYAYGRGVVPQLFVDWMKSNIKEIQSSDDMELFGYYFEAVIGFFYGRNAEKKQREKQHAHGQGGYER